MRSTSGSVISQTQNVPAVAIGSEGARRVICRVVDRLKQLHLHDHRRFCRSNVVRVVVLDLGSADGLLWCGALNERVAPSLLARHTGPNAGAFEQRGNALAPFRIGGDGQRLLCLGLSWHAHICMDLGCQKQMRVDRRSKEPPYETTSDCNICVCADRFVSVPL